MSLIGKFGCKTKILSCLHHHSKRYKRRKMMKGELPWNHWTPLTFRAAIYKYVNEQDYAELKDIPTNNNKNSSNSSNNEFVNNIESINDSSQRFDFKTGIRNASSFKSIESLDPVKFKENSEKIYNDEYRTKHSHKFKIHDHLQYKSPTNNTYDFNNEISKDNGLFNPELWRDYAFKTFIIDRTKFGNVPCYPVYQPKLRRFFTSIRLIKGSKKDLQRCLQAYLGKDAEIIIKQSGINVYGEKYRDQVKHFVLKMGF